jgi:hypothetical protein
MSYYHRFSKAQNQEPDNAFCFKILRARIQRFGNNEHAFTTNYLNYNIESVGDLQINQPERVPTYRLVNDASVTPTSFTLLNPVGGITCPNKLPDVFIEPF